MKKNIKKNILVEPKSEEDIKTYLLNQLKDISVPSAFAKDAIVLKIKNSKRKITIINRPYNVDKFGFIPGQIVEMLVGPDLRFATHKIGIYVGVNLYHKKKMWFLFYESDGIVSLVDNYSGCACTYKFFSEMEKEGKLRLLDNPK